MNRGILRLLTATFIALGIPGCASTLRTARPTLNADVEYLITSAATDFHEHRPPDPVRFRAVKAGHYTAPGGETKYLICGEFLPADKQGTSEWMSFATIQTSKYEQWLGGSTLTFCNSTSVTWDKFDDLSSALQLRLDSLR
ncbi:MAG TPA: hypothetical protein VM100_00165 [Longimicrobiales bacterium]|nr:hypothetical protein [Longimicrobiales bacterium]